MVGTSVVRISVASISEIEESVNTWVGGASVEGRLPAGSQTSLLVIVEGREVVVSGPDVTADISVT